MAIDTPNLKRPSKSSGSLTLILASCFLLSGCTLAVNFVHSQGEANDVVDDQMGASADKASFPTGIKICLNYLPQEWL